MAYFIYQKQKIYYQEIGTGTPLLMLHGNTASSVMFSDIASKYAKDYRVILIDFLGYGKSDRVTELAEDLWFDEGMQIICFLEEKKYRNVKLIGTSGGALAALNVSLERPDLVSHLIADSFEGEQANPDITEALRRGRKVSKNDYGARMFYKMMNGIDWERVVDADTRAVIAHANHIRNFFHKSLYELKPKVLFTGSKKDPLFPCGFYEALFKNMLHKIEHGQQYLFESGGHPAMLSNQEEFIEISKNFLNK